MADTVYIGDTLRVDFQLLGAKGPIPLPAGTKLWAGVKRRTSDADPPLFVVENAAAGGSDAQIAITSEGEGKFAAYFPPSQTSTLTHGETYQCDGRGQMLDGSVFTAGIATFKAEWPVTRTLA